MQTEIALVANLKPPKRNVRVHPEKQIIELARAIEKFGQTRPVVVDEKNTILAGNGLVKACQRLGRTEISVYRMTGLSAADKTKVMLSDNKIYSLGLDDYDGMLEAIRGLETDLDIPGFDVDILKSMTFDTNAVTDAALASFGVLPPQAIVGAQERNIGEGSTAAPEPTIPTPDPPGSVRCPHCNSVFVPE